MEGSEPFTADKHLWMDIVIRRRGLRDGPNREYRDTSILLDVTPAGPQAQVYLRGGRADHDGSAASTSKAHKRQHYARPGHVSFDERNAASTSKARNRQHYARPGHVSFDERSRKLATLAVDALGA